MTENTPKFPAFQKRMTKLGCTFDERGAGNTASVWFSDGSTKTEISLFSLDSTGLKPTNRGDWMSAKWGIRRGFIKLHVGVEYVLMSPSARLRLILGATRPLARQRALPVLRQAA